MNALIILIPQDDLWLWLILFTLAYISVMCSGILVGSYLGSLIKRRQDWS